MVKARAQNRPKSSPPRGGGVLVLGSRDYITLLGYPCWHLWGGVRVPHFVKGMQSPLQNANVSSSFLYKMLHPQVSNCMFLLEHPPSILLSTKCHLGCVETNCWAHFGQILTIHLVEKYAGNIRIRFAISFCKDLTREFPEHQFRPKTLQNAFLSGLYWGIPRTPV